MKHPLSEPFPGTLVGFVGSLFVFSLEAEEGVDGSVGHVGCDGFEMWWIRLMK